MVISIHHRKFNHLLIHYRMTAIILKCQLGEKCQSGELED